MADITSTDNEESKLITLFSNGKSPSGNDFKTLIKYINGQIIDCSVPNIQPIELGTGLVQKYNLVSLPKGGTSVPLFIYNETSIYLLTVSVLSEEGYISNSYKITEGNFFLLKEDSKFDIKSNSPQLSSNVSLSGSTEEEKVIIFIDVESDLANEVNVCLEFKYLK